MSKKAAAKATPNPRMPADPTPGPAARPALEPRPRLFYALLASVGVWIAALLVLYFTTVYPNRPSTPPGQADGSGAPDTTQETVAR
jgi:hypothetical protein